jgi:heptosyltransferase-2
MKKNNSNLENKSSSSEGIGEAFKILVIQQKMIGDVLTSTLICENLKLNFPEAEVHYLVNRFTIPVVEGNPYIDKIIIFEDEYKQSKLRFYKFLKTISKSNYTHVFDAYTKLESLLISKFSRAKYKYGFKKAYSKFYYTKTTPMTNTAETEAGSAIENRLSLTKLISDIKIYNQKPKIYLSEKEKTESAKQFKVLNVKPENCIIISALGSDLKKTYPFEYFGVILDTIVKQTNKKLILNYMPSQQKYIDELLKYCSTKTKSNILQGIEMKSLRSFMCVCSQCVAIIGNEGGAINIAKALDVPSFSIFSPWISKVGWNSFEKTHLNKSVHLSDYYPELYDKHSRKYKDQYFELYKRLKPELFTKKLETFLEKI